MSYRISSKIHNGFSRSIRLVIEPWATEHMLAPGETAELRTMCLHTPPQVDLELCDYGAVFTVNTSDTTYEYWKNGELIE